MSRFLRICAAVTLLGAAKVLEVADDIYDEIKANNSKKEEKREPEAPDFNTCSLKEKVQYYLNVTNFYLMNYKLNPYMENQCIQMADIGLKVRDSDVDGKEAMIKEIEERLAHFRHCINAQGLRPIRR